MTDIAMQRAAFLRRQHEAACFDVGSHPDEVDTPYSAGADAIERLAAIDRKAPPHSPKQAV
ncbi:MAG: hypothetical protein KBT76_14620 [Sulfitobacter litoralis]|nr:hypothetical protein [Sulfitobacter litoralis]MBQ0802963.1 hypothetical protein [Sulfitobacter litoralis]